MAVAFASKNLISAADMSASFQSDEINLTQKGGFCIHSIFTGSPVGSMYIAVSIDGSNWIVLADSAQAIAAAGDVFYNVDAAKYCAARLHYTYSSGTGSCTSYFSTKEVV